ncbi:ATP-binding protein [Spiroplasma endosymbiont of Dioctria linearis]|uniref:ATP-binding protein n=1 Tax=Spiroplasma endosymbiont of Dioctria linearis TaxID=3066290 RepID=UPI00313C1E84
MEDAIGYVTKVNLDVRKVYIYCFESDSDSPYNLKTKNFNPHANTLVKIQTGFNTIILKIIGAQYIRNKSTGGEIYKELDATIYGSFINKKNTENFIKGSFGIPIILGSRVYELTLEDLKIINNDLKLKNEYEIGKDLENDNFNVKTNLNNFFASHLGIFGNTGSGKSVTLSKIFSDLIENRELFNSHIKVKLFLFDYNNEYSNSICENNLSNFSKTIYLDNKNKITINFNEINGDIWCNVLNATTKTQAPLIKKSWKEYKKIIKEEKNEVEKYLQDIIFKICKDKKFDWLFKLKTIIENSNFLFKDDESWKLFLKNLNKIRIAKKDGGTGSAHIGEIFLNQEPDIKINETIKTEIFQNSIKLQTNISKDINFFVFLILYHIVIDGGNDDWLMPVYNRSLLVRDEFNDIFDLNFENDFFDFFDFFDNGISIFELQNYTDSNKNIIINFITSLILGKIKKAEKNKNYINLIIDEAHNVTVKSEDDENISSLNILKKIIREGRKYGLFLTLASQRPADIPTDILSQMHNFIIHKLINDKDIDIIKQTNSYVGNDKIGLLPTLVPGQCLVSGTAFEDARFIKIDIENMKGTKPKSENILLFDKK